MLPGWLWRLFFQMHNKRTQFRLRPSFVMGKKVVVIRRRCVIMVENRRKRMLL